MLTNITIRNFVIIDSLSLEFGSGMTALTGETGAGKSILLGAMGLVLGDRADNDTIKQDCDHAEIIAEFDIGSADNVIAWLRDNDLESLDGDTQECILRRRIARDGRSRAHINGTPVNLALLREIGDLLVDIHGQHEHQSLMRKGSQRELLDRFGKPIDLLTEVASLHHELADTYSRLEQLENDTSDRNSRVEFLRFQIEELDALDIAEEEYRGLSERHQLLANAERLISSTGDALHRLSDAEDDSIQSSLASVTGIIDSIADTDERLKPILSSLNEAQIQIDEAVSDLRHYTDGLDLDGDDLVTVENRMSSIHDIARKHNVAPDTLFSLHQELRQELDDIDHADERLEDLKKRCVELRADYDSACDKLFSARKKTARKLDDGISDAMQALGMKGGRFLIEIKHDKERFTSHGQDEILFTVAANSGSECKPLAKVASGGELARISLAIQMMTSKQNTIHTLIFDEVDSGVGGGIAEVVGRHLRELGDSNQVMCITHLPQVASQAHHHLRVHKTSDDKITTTQVDPLTHQQRIEEIARMLSGVDITEQSLANAEDMITRASTG